MNILHSKCCLTIGAVPLFGLELHASYDWEPVAPEHITIFLQYTVLCFFQRRRNKLVKHLIQHVVLIAGNKESFCYGQVGIGKLEVAEGH